MFFLFYITAKVAEKIGDSLNDAVDVVGEWGDKFADWVNDEDNDD